MKKIISFIIAVACIVSSVSLSLCSNAAGWLENAKSVEFGTTYDLSVNAGNPDYSSLGSYGYYLAVKVYVPATGKITYYSESEFKVSLPNSLEVYSSNNLNEPLLDYYCERDYNSAYGVYYSTKTFTLDKGTYYFLLDIYDYTNEIRWGECDGSFLLNIKYSCSISKPSGLKCTARTTSTEKVAWNKVSGVTGYQVQRSDGGTKWAQSKKVSGTSATFSGLTAGGKYKFRVRAYKTINGVDYYSGWSSILDSCAKPATVKIKSVSSPKKAQIKATWAKVGGVATGYQIAYYKNAKCTSLACCKYAKSQKTTAYTLSKAARGKIFYTRVRAYTNFGGKTYWGAWSKAVKVKCK